MEIVSLVGMVDVIPPTYPKELAIEKIENDLNDREQFENSVVELLPKMKLLVLKYEKQWNKKMKQFNLLEQEQVMKEFRETYLDK